MPHFRAMVDAFLPDEQKVAALREALPATGAGIYLDTVTAGPLPAETARAMSDADAWDLRTGRGGPDRAEDAALREDEARAVLAALLGGEPSEVRLAHGLNDALARGVRLLGLGPGDRMITVGPPSDRALGLLTMVARESRARLDIVATEPDAGETGVLDALAEALAGPARLVIAPIVDESTGARMPIAGVADLAAAHGAALGLDAGCAAGVLPLEVTSAGAAFVALPGHRWLLGPEGTGALWVDRDVRVGAAAPLVRPPDGAPELDPLPRTAALGLARSVGWLEMYVGLPWLYERTERLSSLLVRGLAAIDGVELLSPLDRAAAIATFRIRRWGAEQAADELEHRVHAILSVVRGERESGAIRASLGAWNTEDELARFLEGVALLARHTPDSVPHRPVIAVLAESVNDRCSAATGPSSAFVVGSAMAPGAQPTASRPACRAGKPGRGGRRRRSHPRLRVADRPRRVPAGR